MKRTIYLLLALVLVMSLFFTVLSCAEKPTAAKVYKMKYAGRHPPTSVVATQSEQYFIARVMDRSKGRIQIEYYPSDQLGGMNEMLDVVGGGSAEMGYMVPAIFTGKIPVLGVQDLPFLFDCSVEDHIRIIMEMQRQPDYAGAIEQHNVKFLTGDCQGTMAFYLKEPLKTMGDFAGRKIRCAGAMQAATVNTLGGSAQSLASPEVYMAVQTGVLDGTMWHPDSAVANRIYEVTKYAVIPYISVSGYTGARLMNADVWNSLPEDLQKAVMQAADDTDKHVVESFPGFEKEAIDKLAANGMDVYYVPKEENERWRDACRPVWDKWLAENGAPGQRLLDFVLEKLGEK